MSFLDQAVITAKSGDGGRGCVSFRRERFIPRGGPDGGDGGDGGNIAARASRSIYSLSDYGRDIAYRAPNGQPGRGKGQSGRKGADLVLRVPLGTVIQDSETGEILADLTKNNQEVILIPGGKGGKGNRHFATSVNRAPRTAQPGIPGREKRLRLTLKFLADIGLVGLPNAGKSTLLSRLSNARPKVGAYPFTTIRPNLGIMTLENGTDLMVADIPGLIKGASKGRGLGHEFLRHIERTGILVHLLDITYEPQGDDPLEDFHLLRMELKAHGEDLFKKPCLVVVNKMDLYNNGTRNREEISKALEAGAMAYYFVSALTGEGIEQLRQGILERWHSLEETDHGSHQPENTCLQPLS